MTVIDIIALFNLILLAKMNAQPDQQYYVKKNNVLETSCFFV